MQARREAGDRPNRRAQPGPPGAPRASSLPRFRADALHTWACRSLRVEKSEPGACGGEGGLVVRPPPPHLNYPDSVASLPASLTRSTRGQSGRRGHQLLSLGHRPGASVRERAGA